jgi:hypothetical protein
MFIYTARGKGRKCYKKMELGIDVFTRYAGCHPWSIIKV